MSIGYLDVVALSLILGFRQDVDGHHSRSSCAKRAPTSPVVLSLTETGRPPASAPDVTGTLLVEQAFTPSLARRRTNEPAEDLHRIAHRRPCGGRRLVYEAARSWTGLPADGHAGAVGALRPGRGSAFNRRRDRRQGRDVPCTSTMSRPSAAGCRAWGSCSGTTLRATTRRWRRCVILTATCSRWRRRPRGPIRRHDRAGRAKSASSKKRAGRAEIEVSHPGRRSRPRSRRPGSAA